MTAISPRWNGKKERFRSMSFEHINATGCSPVLNPFFESSGTQSIRVKALVKMVIYSSVTSNIFACWTHAWRSFSSKHCAWRSKLHCTEQGYIGGSFKTMSTGSLSSLHSVWDSSRLQLSIEIFAWSRISCSIENASEVQPAPLPLGSFVLSFV